MNQHNSIFDPAYGLNLQAKKFITLQNYYQTMARFIVTTKQMKNANGIRIEPGMSVEVVTQSMNNPVLTNSGQLVVDAFMRIYGIDIRRAGALNMSYLDVERI